MIGGCASLGVRLLCWISWRPLTERPANPGEGSLRARIFMRLLQLTFFGARYDGTVVASWFVRRAAACRGLITGVPLDGRRAVHTAARAHGPSPGPAGRSTVVAPHLTRV